MEPAHLMFMTANRTQWLLLIALFLAHAYALTLRPTRAVPAEPVAPVPVIRPLEKIAVPAEPLPPQGMPPTREAPPAIEQQTPVQPIEERGDALIFESEALLGMPFDQAVVMPFDCFSSAE